MLWWKLLSFKGAYTNTDLKIFVYVCVYVKIISSKFCSLNPKFLFLFLYVCKQTFLISEVHISQKNERYYNAKSAFNV